MKITWATHTFHSLTTVQRKFISAANGMFQAIGQHETIQNLIVDGRSGKSAQVDID